MLNNKKNSDFKDVTPRSVTQELEDNRPFKIWLKEYGLRYAVIFFTCLLCAFFLSPKSTHSNIDINNIKVGSIAKQDYKAFEDMTVADSVTTTQKREEAAAKIRPCFNLNVSKSANAIHQLTSSFTQMRNELEKLRQELNTVNDANSDQIVTEGTTDSHGRPVIEPTAAQKTARYLQNIDTFRKNLQQPITEEQFLVLAAHDFSIDIQNIGLETLKTLFPRDILLMRNIFLLTDKFPEGITVLSNSINPHDVSYSLDLITDLDSQKQKVAGVLNDLNKGTTPFDSDVLGILDIIIQNFLEVTIEPNETETRARQNRARESIPPIAYSYKAGQIICRAGEPITLTQQRALAQMAQVGEKKVTNALQVGFGAFIILFVLFFVALQYWDNDFKKITINCRDLLFFLLSFLLSVLLLLICSWLGTTDKILNATADNSNGFQLDTLIYLMPFASLVMTVRFILGRSKAFVFAFMVSIMTALSFNGNTAVYYAVYIVVGALTGSWFVAHANERRYVVKTGFAVVTCNLIMVLAISAISYNPDIGFNGKHLLLNLGAAIISGVLSAFLFTALVQAMENIFGYITDARLLELGNLNHPLLRKLMVEAPGTYHHSVMVDMLAEAVAPAIGANPLMIRAMAYFHDIGKMKAPQYFAENQTGDNPHDSLKPIMSARILKAHVSDGVKIAQEYKLGEFIESAIMEHHGTTKVGFYFKAKEMETPEDPVNENDYRYPGPIPQTKESALLMLADSVEAAVKSIKEPNIDRITNMVNKIINGKFTDEQLNNCALTLRDLHIIAKCFSETLDGMNYKRPEYSSTSNNSKTKSVNMKDGKIAGKTEVAQPTSNEPKEEDNANSDQKQTKRPESHLYNTTDDGPKGIKHLGQI